MQINGIIDAKETVKRKVWGLGMKTSKAYGKKIEKNVFP